MILGYLVCYILFVAPIAFLRTMSMEEWIAAMEAEAPVLIQFVSYPTIFGSPYYVAITVIFRVMAGFLVGEAVILIVSCAIFYKKLQAWKKTISSSTHKLQLMLFAALVSQVTKFL